MIFVFDGFELDAERLELRRGGKVLKVDSPVLRLLAALVSRPDQLITKDELVHEVWGGRAVADNVITVTMTRLRKLLTSRPGGPNAVSTIYGRGYRFVRPVTTLAERSMGAIEDVVPQRLPFVGRDQVLSHLRAAVQSARAGQGRLIALTGEAGIGKTSIVEVLERELSRSELRVAWGFCRESSETPPLWPFEQLFLEITGGSGDLRALAYGELSSAASGSSELGDAALARAAQGPRNGDGSSARKRAFEAIVRMFTSATEGEPFLLVLDDLDRADEASLELLSHLADRLSRSRLLIVATLRAEDAGGRARAETCLPRILGHRNCERILLPRLREEDVAFYVSALLHDRDGRLSRAVYQKSEGNPFFMSELSRQLSEQVTPEPEALAVPYAALELVRQRVAKLDAGARGLLSTCAVIGRSVDLRVLAEATGRTTASVIESLDDAQRAGVLAAGADPSGRFQFSHELIRSALYESLSAQERRRQHCAVADALERRKSVGDAIAPSELAFHYHAALPEGDLHKTVHYCRRAAEAAISVFAYAEVARHSRHALEALRLLSAPSIRLRMSLLYVTAIYSRPHDSLGFQRCTDELIRLGRERQDGEMLVRAGGLLNPHPGLAPLPNASQVMRDALSLLSEERVGLRAVAMAGLSAASPHCYEREQAEALAREAAALARESNSRVALYFTLLAQLHVVAGAADPSLAEGIAAQLESLALESPVEVAALPIDLGLFRAGRALSRGDVEAALIALDRGLSRAREIQHAELVFHCERIRALLRLRQGSRERAREELSLLHERAKRLSLMGVEAFLAYDRVVVLKDGRALVRDDGLRRALRYDPEDPPALWAMKVRALAVGGLSDEARASLRELSPEQLSNLPHDGQYLGTLAHLTHAALLLTEPSYQSALKTLLWPHRDQHACHLWAAFDGPVSGLLNLLAGAEHRALASGGPPLLAAGTRG